MKYLYLSLLLTAFMFLSVSVYAQNKKFEISPELVEDFYNNGTINIENRSLCYNLIEKVIYDLDQDGMKDTILLYHIDLLKNDPGDFHRIKVNLANGYCLDKLNIGGWVKNIRFNTEKNEICSNTKNNSK